MFVDEIVDDNLKKFSEPVDKLTWHCYNSNVLSKLCIKEVFV